MDTITRSYEILDELRLPNGLYKASASDDYNYVWLRDSFYEALPYLNKDDNKYEQTYHAILDIFRKYEWKLDIHTKQKPQYTHEYLHPRYDLEGNEVNEEWGNCQHDAIGAVLFGIGKGVEAGKNIIRDNADKRIVQKLVYYLDTCEYWKDEDNGIWEENREVHMSSVGACVAGLQAVKDAKIAHAPFHLIDAGMNTIYELFPYESKTKPVDLAQLSLIYPFGIFRGDDALEIINRVCKTLLREFGVLRYLGDSYYSVFEDDRNSHPWKYYGSEAEWTMGLPWLSLCYHIMGRDDMAHIFVRKTEKAMCHDGKLPELYYSGTSIQNKNNPLGWSQALYILAKESLE